MTDFLLKTFCRGYNEENNRSAREKCGVFSSVVGVIVNLLLATAKFIAGTLSGSIAIVADALNNFSDAGSSIVSFVSFKISSSKFVYRLFAEVDIVRFVFPCLSIGKQVCRGYVRRIYPCRQGIFNCSYNAYDTFGERIVT